jgi:hypothetical protein
VRIGGAVGNLSDDHHPEPGEARRAHSSDRCQWRLGNSPCLCRCQFFWDSVRASIILHPRPRILTLPFSAAHTHHPVSDEQRQHRPLTGRRRLHDELRARSSEPHATSDERKARRYIAGRQRRPMPEPWARSTYADDHDCSGDRSEEAPKPQATPASRIRHTYGHSRTPRTHLLACYPHSLSRAATHNTSAPLHSAIPAHLARLFL